MSRSQERGIAVCRYTNLGIAALAAVFFFLFPAIKVISDLCDPNIRGAGIPRSAWGFHEALSPRYERWATQRLNSARATELSTDNIAGTEWPLFGSIFYLWATESLQDAWAKEHAGAPAPNIYARGAIDAATRLVIDPRQANWVKIHWGTNYLRKENVFYRMLVISALTSHARLTRDQQYIPMLRDQVESFSAELDASSHGLLNDYPSECYPGDVLTAVAAIRHADTVLGTDHSSFARRALRGFQGEALDPRGLVPYDASAERGKPSGSSRGCGNSYVSLFAPAIWPEQANKWYALYSKFFWQEGWACAGFREFPNDLGRGNWYMDVDAGPVLDGFGCAACAFGVGAARVNGHFEHAYPLTAQLLATSWPLPNGTRLLPRLLSNAADAPYLGEAGILFNLTREPAKGLPLRTGGSIPGLVFIVLTLQIGLGLFLLAGITLSVRRFRKHCDSLVLAYPRIQIGMWVCLVLFATVLVIAGAPLVAAIIFLVAQFFPRYQRH
ncbi:MAG: hypothetical protein JWM16_417 [Verrucomicrobiales bacterium]|nr:hypothetical protein [Verrucomicrobiales bacterium]